MFLRTVKAAGGKGFQHEYLRLVEAYRENGKNKQRVVCHLGRKDLLAAHLDSLVRLLRGQPRGGAGPTAGEVRATGAWDWGPMLVARTLWRELGLATILDRRGGRSRDDGVALSERALVLVTNRLCAPTSEHGLARWFETDFVCDREGRRWMPRWRADQDRRRSHLPRVRVEFRQLKQWYRTLDQLHARKSQIERELYLRLRDLFSLQVDVVFYDVTSTYFEGVGPPLLGAHGHSRDAKPVGQVLKDLEQRFGLRRVVFVGDRGMVTVDNLKLLRSREQGYVVGLNRRRRENVYRYIERATGAWTDCPLGIAAREMEKPPRTAVQEVAADEPGVRIFIVKSEERAGYETAQRLKAMDRVRTQLERLTRRVEQGKLKAADKIGAAAARTLGRYHGYRYYDWELKEGRFRFFEHPVNLKREQAYEGKYVIQTEEKDLTPVQAVSIYKDLSEVERAFCHLKDVIEMRPIYHQTDKRVEAHIFVASLAFLLHRAIEKHLKAAEQDLSATEALQVLRTVRVVDLTLGGGKTKQIGR